MRLGRPQGFEERTGVDPSAVGAQQFLQKRVFAGREVEGSAVRVGEPSDGIDRQAAAVSMSVRTGRRSRSTVRMTSSPESTGRSRSRSITSYCPRESRSNASTPVPARPVAYPSCLRQSSSTAARSASSSTIRILAIFHCLRFRFMVSMRLPSALHCARCGCALGERDTHPSHTESRL